MKHHGEDMELRFLSEDGNPKSKVNIKGMSAGRQDWNDAGIGGQSTLHFDISFFSVEGDSELTGIDPNKLRPYKCKVVIGTLALTFVEIQEITAISFVAKFRKGKKPEVTGKELY